MYDLALSVMSCLGAGTRADLAWLVDVQGLAEDRVRNQGDALVITPGGGRIGSILGGALDDELADLARLRSQGRLVELPISEFAALLAGLPTPSGTASARCLLMPATELPAQLWPLLRDRAPCCLVTELDGTVTGATTLYTQESIHDAGAEITQLFARESTTVVVLDDVIVTVLWPVPRLLIVGGGPMADALDAAARLLEWAPQRLSTVRDIDRMSELSPSDAVVVVGHDLELTGAALARALAAGAGYIGALGPPALHRARAQWLADRGIDADRIHAPAGIDIGARKPLEVAVAVLAEIIAARNR